MKVYTRLHNGFWKWTLYPLSARQAHLVRELSMPTTGSGCRDEEEARAIGQKARNQIRCVEAAGR
jgi:hypothetical protein